jgi:hypothetical protein
MFFLHSSFPSEKIDVLLCLLCWVEILLRRKENGDVIEKEEEEELRKLLESEEESRSRFNSDDRNDPNKSFKELKPGGKKSVKGDGSNKNSNTNAFKKDLSSMNNKVVTQKGVQGSYLKATDTVMRPITQQHPLRVLNNSPSSSLSPTSNSSTIFPSSTYSLTTRPYTSASRSSTHSLSSFHIPLPNSSVSIRSSIVSMSSLDREIIPVIPPAYHRNNSIKKEKKTSAYPDKKGGNTNSTSTKEFPLSLKSSSNSKKGISSFIRKQEKPYISPAFLKLPYYYYYYYYLVMRFW